MDENKIEITVELDTSKAEKQAEDLNDALVDGAKDANKEFKKYSDDVNKNLNKIKQQVNKTFDGAKMANSLTSKVGKALNGIKSKINSILGNINVKTTVNANTSSQQGSTGSSGASSMGASLVTGSAIGSQLVKALSLDKPLQQAKSLLDVFRNIANSIKTIKIGDKQFDIGESVNAISIYQRALNDTQDEHYTFGKTVDNLNDRLRKVKENLNKADVEFYDVDDAINETIKVLERLGLEGALVPKKLANSYKYMGEVLDDLLNKLHSCDSAMVDEFGNEMFDVSQFNGLKVLVNDLLKTTSGFSKFKLVVANTMMTVREVVGSGVDTIKSKLNNTMFKPLVDGIGKVKSALSSSKLGQAFKQGFNEPQQYIDRMKNKIQEWANKHKQATEKVKSANKSVGGSFKSLLQQVLPFASIYGIFNGLKTSVMSYADSLQQASKFAYTFGDATGEMNEWLEEQDALYNMSKTEVMDFSSNLYRMGLNMNMAQQDAMSMSQQMSELAINLKAFTGSEQSFEAIASALRGEYDSLQTLGFALDADTVKAKALSMGLNSSSESCLVLARQAILLEQGANILGYASQNVNSLSFQMALLRENVGKLANAFGAMFGGLLTACLPVLNAIVSAVTKAVNAIANAINSILSLFGISVTGGGFSGSIGGGGIGGALGGIADTIGGVADSVGGVSDDLGGVADSIDGAGSGVADNLADGAESAKEIAKGLMGIDELNTISLPKGDKGSGSGGSGSGSGGSGSGGSGSGGLGSGGGNGIGGLGDGFGLSQTSSVLEEVNGELTKFQKGFLAIWEQLVDGFNRHKDAIISLWNELKSNLNALGQSMADFFVSAWQNGLDRTVNLIGGIVGAVVETALRIANSVVEVVKGLFDHLNPNNNENTKKFIDALNNLLEQVEGFITDVGKWFGQFATACQPFINNLGDIAMIVGGILAQVLADAIQLIRDFMNSFIGQALIEGIAGALEWLSGVLESCLGFIQEHITFFEALGLGILGAWGAFKLINGAITIWNGLMTIFASIGAICSTVTTILGGAIAFLTSPIGLVVLAIGALIGAGYLLYKHWDEVKEWALNLWDSITEIWDGIKQVVVDAVSGIWDAFSERFPKCAEFVETIFNNMKTIISSILNIIKSVIVTVIKVIVAIFTGDFGAIKDIVKNHFETCKTHASNIWNAIKNNLSTIFNGIKTVLSSILSNIVNAVKDKFNSAKNTAISVWNGIRDGISNAINSVKTTIGTVITNITTSISNGFTNAKNKAVSIIEGMKTKVKSVFDGIWSTIKGVVDKLKSAFNFKWSLPSLKLPRISVTGGEAPFGIGGKGSLPKFSIRWASDGAIFTSKTLLGVGDASKGVGNASEAILPIDRLWKEMDKQFTKQNQALNKGNNQPINITLKLDGREISKATFKNFEELSRLGIIDLSTLI